MPQTVAYTREPFDPEKHDGAAFSCGVEQVDNYFQNTANELTKADNVRVYVMVDPDGTVIGFYALNAQAVQFTDLPATFARTPPSHGNIPAAYISMIGRDRKVRGAGFGGDLLVDALRRIRVAATQGALPELRVSAVAFERTQNVPARQHGSQADR